MTGKHKKILSLFIKAAIVVFAFWFIYHKLVANRNLRDFSTLLKDIPRQKLLL
uniref:hypothetical protein n=1 Tax=Pedobacter roseus TaxID=336820 RepID=UPI001FEC1B72|nr:hypothetical protein [Pedobacter roseus]